MRRPHTPHGSPLPSEASRRERPDESGAAPASPALTSVLFAGPTSGRDRSVWCVEAPGHCVSRMLQGRPQSRGQPSGPPSQTASGSQQGGPGNSPARPETKQSNGLLPLGSGPPGSVKILGRSGPDWPVLPLVRPGVQLPGTRPPPPRPGYRPDGLLNPGGERDPRQPGLPPTHRRRPRAGSRHQASPAPLLPHSPSASDSGLSATFGDRGRVPWSEPPS
ncbi:hypothetical protein NDU88_001947 [Pleurodeles waltl]|uniref:Basic proline-rich protein-like n=1 Tax=Pleurodeles waltl TaxID=8319 RepID=A0AAV7PCN1_PLEWA|nr:hypothetical protein NDU88_001947 [Pleurodeles waltl]